MTRRMGLGRICLLGIVLGTGLVGCGDEEIAVPECSIRWTDAPCADDWEGLYVCDPCGAVFHCLVASDQPELYSWSPTTYPCSCIEPDHTLSWEDECRWDVI